MLTLDLELQFAKFVEMMLWMVDGGRNIYYLTQDLEK